ncbi:hypothetical protein ABZ776_07345 [Streptomyces sp. NPDC007076]|uniref:WXG100-like domain-containing protein n=1 Tax=Streptomyces sp. NPDC007076 TaxID=3160975 RepID=UPI0033E4ED32
MLTPSPEAQTLLLVFSGEKWPSINEDLLREVADYYDALVGNFDDLQTYLVGAESYIKANFSGKAADQFAQYAEYLSGGGNTSILNGCADQAQNLAKIARDTANQAEYAKWMILAQVIELMIEMAFEAAVSWIPGLNAIASAMTAIAEMALMMIAKAVIKSLIRSILIHTAISVAIGAAMDVAIQLIQKGQGNRKDWDWDATKSALGFGALQGVFGGVFNPIGGALGKKLGKIVGSDGAKWLGEQIGHHLDTLAGKTGANKGLAHTLGNILGGVDGELVKNLDKGTGKLVSDSFVDKVGNAFAKYGFNGLEGDAARNVGKTWANSLNKHWSTDLAVHQVSENIAKDLAKNVGGQVDASALKTLSHTITGDVAKSVSSKAMSETLSKMQKFGFAAGLYGTSAVIEAGAQNLAEGTYNLMTQGTFTTSWETFVSGVAPNAFSHAMRHTVVHPFLAHSNSPIANFLKGLNSKLDTLDTLPGEYGPKLTSNDASVPVGQVSADRATTETHTGPDPETNTDPELNTGLVSTASTTSMVSSTSTNSPESTVPPAPSPVVTQTQTVTQEVTQAVTQTTSQAQAQTQVQTAKQATPQTPAQTVSTPTPSVSVSVSGNGSKAPVPTPLVPRPTQSNVSSSAFSNELPNYSAPKPTPTASQTLGTPLTPTPTPTPMPTSTSESVPEATPDSVGQTDLSNESIQVTDDDQVLHNDDLNHDNVHHANQDVSRDDNHNAGNDLGSPTNPTPTTPPALTLTNSDGTTKPIHIPGFLNDVSTYLDADEQAPFHGAVGGHLAVQLDHSSKDPVQLAGELADKAGVTLHAPDALALALADQPHTFLGDGRRFTVTTADGRKRELRVKAIPDQNEWKVIPEDENAPTDPVKFDTVQRSQQTEGPSYSDSSTVQAPVSVAIGANVVGRITVTPGMTTSRDSNLNTQLLSQRETRSHGPSVKLGTHVTYELTLHDIPVTESADPPGTHTGAHVITHTVPNGMVVRIPEAHTTSVRPDPRKDRVPLKFTAVSGERASIEHTESYFNLDAMTDWVLQHTDSPIGSSNYQAVVDHFSAEHFTQIDGRDPVPPLRLHKTDGSVSGTVTIGRPVPKRHWVIDTGTDFELRDTGQFTQKNESSVHRDHNLDASLFVGGQADPTGFSEAFAAPRIQAGLTFGYGHSSRNTANLGGAAGAKHGERSPKDVRTVLVLRESLVTVRMPDGTHQTFTVGSLVRMPVGEAQRLAGWDNQDGLRVGVNAPEKPAYWNGEDGKVTMLGPGRPGEIHIDTHSRNPEAAANDVRTPEQKLVDSLLDDLKKADPGLPLATRAQVAAAEQHRSWFKRLFRRGRASVNAVNNTRTLMAALSKQGLREGMHQAATAEGIRVNLLGSTFTRDRGYTLTVRADLHDPTYVGSARRTSTEATGGGERFDTGQQITHTFGVGLEATFAARQNAKDELGTPINTGTGGVGVRGMLRTTRQVKSGGTATREDLFAPTPGTDYYDFAGRLTFEIQRSAFPQPLMQALTLGGMRALARYGRDSHVRAVKWLYEHAGLGGIGETVDGKTSVQLTSHPLAFTFGVPDGLSKASGMSDADRGRFTGSLESSALPDVESPEQDAITSKGLAAVTLSTRPDRTLLDSALDLAGKTSGGAWRLTDAGALMSERIRRIFGQHSLTALSDQVFSPGGHTVGNLHDKGTLFGGDESLSLTGTRHNLKVVGTSFTASPEMNTALEQAFGYTRGRSWGGTIGTTGMFAGLEAAGGAHFTGQGGTSHTWLQKFWSRSNASSTTSTRDLNQVLGNDRWVLVVADTDFRIGARHKPLGIFGRPFGSSRSDSTQVIRKPGGWVGLIRERDAMKAGLIDDGLGPVPEGALPGVKWHSRGDLDGASRGAFAHNAPQDAAGLKKLGESLEKAGIAEQTRHTINAMVSARSARSAIQTGGTLTSRGRTSALAHVRKLNILGKDVAITVRHERVGTPKVVDTLFGDHELGASRSISQETSFASSNSHAHGVNGGETVRGPGGSGGLTASAGGGFNDSVTAADSVSGVVTQVTTLPGPKAVVETEWRTTVTVTYSDGANAIEPATWNATVTTSESYLMLEPEGDGDAPRTPPTSLRPKAALTIEAPKSGSNPAGLLTETANLNKAAARKGDGGLHIHEVIGAGQVQDLGKLLVSRAHRNDRSRTLRHTYEDGRITEAVNHATRESELVKSGSAGADALETALNDISLTSALSSGHAQSGRHTVTLTDNSVIGGVDTTLVLATHLDFSKARRITVSSQVKFDDLTGTGAGTEMSDGTGISSVGGPGVSGVVAGAGKLTAAPGVPVAGIGTVAGDTHRIGQAEQTRLNLKPPAGHGHLYAVPATFHLAAGAQRHIKDSAVGRPFTSRTALQSGKTEATVLVWLSDERVRELELEQLSTAQAEAAKAVTKAEKAWEDNYKEYWEQRRQMKALETRANAAQDEYVRIRRQADPLYDPNAPDATSESHEEGNADEDVTKAKKARDDSAKEFREGLQKLEDLAKKVNAAGEEYARIRLSADPMFRGDPNAPATAPTFNEEIRHDHGKAKPEDEFTEIAGDDDNPTAITIDGTAHALMDVENVGHGFFNALAEGLKRHGHHAGPQANGPALHRELADRLRPHVAATPHTSETPSTSTPPPYFTELATLVPPDLTDAFTADDVREAGLADLVDNPESEAGKEFHDRGAIPPMKEALTEQQRLALASISAGRDGGRETLTDHGTADLYPALAAALWGVPVTVAHNGKLHTFLPEGGKAGPGAWKQGVLLHLKDGTYRYVDRGTVPATEPETPTQPEPVTQTPEPTSVETVVETPDPETVTETPGPVPTDTPPSPSMSQTSAVMDEEGPGNPTGDRTVSQDIFEVLNATFQVDEPLAELGKQFNVPVMGLVAFDQHLADLHVDRSHWDALDGHLGRHGSTLAELAGGGDPGRIRAAVVDWLAEPVHEPSGAVRDAAARYGTSPDHVERLLRRHGLHDAEGLVDEIGDNLPQTTSLADWFDTHPEALARLRDRQDAARFAAAVHDLGLAVGNEHGTVPGPATGVHLTDFRTWHTGPGHLGHTTDEQLREAVARWYLESHRQLGVLPTGIDVRALARLARTADSAGGTAPAEFHDTVTELLAADSLPQAVDLATALGHGAGLGDVRALTRSLGVDAAVLRPFGGLLGHHLARHAAAPHTIDAAVASFRVDLAHHGFSTADLPSLAAHGATDRTVDPIGTEQLDAFAHYLVNQQTLGSTPHSAVRAWRNLPASAAAAHVETWRANDTADAHDENLVLGTVDITPPTWDQYGRLFHLGPIASRAFRARRVLLPDGSVRAEITLPVKLIHQPGEEHVAEAARRVARSSVDTYLNAPRYRLPNGDLLHVTVEFTDADVPVERYPDGYFKSPSNGVHLVDVSLEPGGRMEARQWKLPGDSPAVFAHELTHLLGPWDYYREHSNTLRPVYTDRALMGGPVIGDHYGQPAISPLSMSTGRLRNQRLMPRDLNLIGSAIETAWKTAGLNPGPRNGMPSLLPLDVAERVLRGNPATGAAGRLAPIGTSGRLRPTPHGDTNPNGTYLASGGGRENRPVMMFPEHWSLEEAAAAVEHVHREQSRRQRIGPDGEFEGVHHGVRIRGHALADGTITDFEPSSRQDDLAPALFANPVDEPHPTPFAKGGAPLATHRLWDFLALGDRSRGIGGHLRIGGQNDENATDPSAVKYRPFGGTTAANHTMRAGAYALELQSWLNQRMRAVLTSPGPAVAVSDGVTNLNALFPDHWGNWAMDDVIRSGHRNALDSGSFTLLPSGGHLWHAVIQGVPMHGQVLDGEHQWVRPSWHQPGHGGPGAHELLAEARDIDFHTADGAHYRMYRTLFRGGEQTTVLVRVLHLPNHRSTTPLLETVRNTTLFVGDSEGLGQTYLRFAVEYDGPDNGPDAVLIDQAASGGGADDLPMLLTPGIGALRLSAPRMLDPGTWQPPEGTNDTPAWRAMTSAALELHGPGALTHESGVDALVQLHTAQELAPHADRERSEQDLVGATDHLFHENAGNRLTIPESLRGRWTADRVRLAALQHSSHGRPVPGRSGPRRLVLEAFPEPDVRLEIHHEQSDDGTWKIADYEIHTADGPGAQPPLWRPEGHVAAAATELGVHPAHLFALGEELGLPHHQVTSAAALLRGLGDPRAVAAELRQLAARLGGVDPVLLTARTSELNIGVEHWWDLAAHLRSTGHTVAELLAEGPGGDLAASWEYRTPKGISEDIALQALTLGVHPRRLELVMEAALIHDPTVFGEHTRPLWSSGLTPEQLAEQLVGHQWRGNFGEMARQFGVVPQAEGASAAFARWSGVPEESASQGLPLNQLTLADITHAVALWRLGQSDPTVTLHDGSDPRPLALLAQRIGMRADHARVHLDGPGRESGALSLTARLEQRYLAAFHTSSLFTDPVSQMAPAPLAVLELADHLVIDPTLLGTIPNLHMGSGETVSALLLQGGDPAVLAGSVHDRLRELGLAPRELAWFQNLSVTAEHIERFWRYVEDHRATHGELDALLTGDRRAGPAAVAKWTEHEAGTTPAPAPLASSSTAPIGQEQDRAQHFSSTTSGQAASTPLPGPNDSLPSALLDLAKQLRPVDGEDRTGLADADLFQGSSPAARGNRLESFRTAVIRAEATTDVDERAARIASDIKASQYFTDGNTRTATSAVFATYAAAGIGLDATPLEVFAAIGEAEVNAAFDLTNWLRERRNDEDGPAELPSIADLERINTMAGQLAAAEAALQRIGGYWRTYVRDHPTESEEDRHENFLGELLEDSEADYDLWSERQEIERAIGLIRPGARGAFLDTVAQRRAPENEDETLAEEIERLMEALGLDE